MTERSYWLDLFTGTTWQEFLDAGGTVSGFRAARWRTVQAIQPGDYLLCYLTGISRFIGILEVASEPFQDLKPIWKSEDFPCRLHVKPIATLSPETAVPIQELRDRLSIFGDNEHGHGWTGHVRGSPARWSTTDGEAVVAAVFDAVRTPVVRTVDPTLMARRPRSSMPDEDGELDGADDQQARSLTPSLDTFANARHFLRVIDGTPYPLLRSLQDRLWDQRGNPQATVEWIDPDVWIPRRLAGDESDLARRLWRESEGSLNPRYLRGVWYLTKKNGLLERGPDDVLHVTDQGRRFLKEPLGPIVAAVDAREGILVLLKIVADRGPGRRSDFLPDFTEFCHAHTNYRSDSPIKGALYDRLTNLVDRALVERGGQTYQITDAGQRYLDANAALVDGGTSRGRSELHHVATKLRRDAKEQLAGYLAEMDPYRFEGLIKLLLEEMGYTDVEVTSPANDKGVDVVANIELGISSVREVVQVKRHKATINRPILDQLRGSLYRFGAVRGTIITTGTFTKGTAQAAFESGAAPITLIDGKRLLDLLIQYEIGVSKKVVDYLEFDRTKLEQFESREAPGAES